VGLAPRRQPPLPAGGRPAYLLPYDSLLPTTTHCPPPTTHHPPPTTHHPTLQHPNTPTPTTHYTYRIPQYTYRIPLQEGAFDFLLYVGAMMVIYTHD
jgi:hypothetical protein